MTRVSSKGWAIGAAFDDERTAEREVRRKAWWERGQGSERRTSTRVYEDETRHLRVPCVPVKIAITGAAGFLGAHLARKTAAPVRIGRTAAPGILSCDDVLRDPALLDGCAVLVHSAAVRHRHGATLTAYRASNVDLVEALMRAAAGRVERFVLVSSVGIYGFPSELPVRESSPLAPRTLYSQTKVEAEKLVRTLGRELGLPYTIVRPSIFYGPGDRNGMLDKLVAMIARHRYLVVGPGDNVLHHAYVEDVGDAILWLASAEAAKNEDFLVSGPETITLRRLSELSARLLGTWLPPVRVPLAFARVAATGIELAGYWNLRDPSVEPPLDHSKLDVMTLPIAFDLSKLAAAGFTPRIGYEEGLARTISGNFHDK